MLLLIHLVYHHIIIINFNKTEKDRKSTRLNSSHVRISYAVFCLKKKTKKITESTTIIVKNAALSRNRACGHTSRCSDWSSTTTSAVPGSQSGTRGNTRTGDSSSG